MIKKYLKKKINGIKICAIITTVCFMVSTLGANLYAIPISENTNKKYEDVFNNASSISSEYGKITALKDANSDVTVVNIQDLHCHPQTQRNISKIIASLANKYNLKSIYVEGGYGNIDTTWLSSIKDESLRKQVIEHLLEEGILTGSEYYNLTSNKNNIELKGIDEEKLHQDNIKRLSWIMDNQGKYREIIKKINKEISFLEIKYINNENKRFNKNIDKYLSNEIDTKRFYRQLIKYVKDINKNPQKYNNITSIKLEDYPNIMRYMTLTKISQKINVKEITSQLYAIINEIKNKVPYDVYTKFVKESDNFQDSQKVVELVTLLCEKSGIDLDNKYESLKKFLQSNEINRNLNTVELVQEERHLIGEIRKALSYNNEEYEITFVSDFNKYFQDYLQYKLTEVDWLYFKNSYKEFRNLYGKYAAVDRIKEIEKDFTEINKYYEINDERNNIFVKNLLQNEKPQIIQTNTVRKEEDVLKNSKEVIIAVTGGFHSKALENILQAKEVNTIVITPSIYDGIEKATKQYKGIIKDQSKLFQSSALAYKIASSLKDSDKQKILYRIVKDIVGDNTEKLKEILGKDVDLSVLENLSPLSEQEQQEAAEIKGKIETAASVLIKYLPVQGGQYIFYPKMDDIILGVSIFLVENGIFFSDGTRLEIENSGSPDLSGIPAETYSRMLDDIQKALFSSQNLSDIAEEGVIEKAREDNNNESKKQGKRKRQSQQTRKGKNKRGVQEKTVERPVFDRAPLTSDREKELLARFYGNRRALNKLIEIDKSMLIGLEQDSELLNIIVDRIKNNIYNEKYLDEFLDVCKECIDFEDSTEDKIIKVRNIEKYLDRFLLEFEDEYVDYFKKLFSLGIQVIKYFNEDFVEVEYVADLMLRDEQLANGTLKDNLEILIGKYDKAFFDPFFCGAVIEPLIDNIDKVNNLSQDDMLYITTLPIGLLNVILNKSQNDSDLLKVIKYVRANFDDISSLPDIIFDILEHKSVNVNSEQLIDIFKYLIYNLDDISLLPGTIFNVLKAKTANAEQLMGIFKYLLDNLDYVVDELDKPDDKNKEIITAIGRKIKTIQEFETVIETLKKYNVTKHWSSKKEQVLDAIKNIEKIENLSSLTFSQLMLFDNESISFVLNNARSSSDIETVISRYYDFGVSSYKNDKDAKQAKVKALVKYVSESDKSFYDKLFSYGTDALNIIVDSIDDVSFVKDYLLNSDYKGIYENLFKELVELEIKNVAFENNYLALKLILNEDFNRILLASTIENISDPKNIVARYYSAIAVSRFIYDSFGKEVYDYRFDDKELIGVIEDVTSTYVHMMKKMLEIVLIDSNTKIYALCNSERHSNGDRFNVKSLREIIKYMGIPVTISEENVYRREGDNTEASEGWLEAIMSFEMDSNGTKGYFVFRGHGGEKALVVYDPGVVDAEKQISNGRATGNEAESITPKQLADALYELATKKQKPVDLRNITIDLSCCNSYFFARNVYDLLEQKFKKEGKEESYPTIITAAGLETKTGITDLTIMEGNLHKGIKRLLDKFQEGTVKVLSLGMIGVSEYLFKNSNITMFTSFFDKSTLDLIDKTREKVSKSTCFTTVKTDSKKDSSVSTEKEVTENDTVSEIKIKPLSKKVVELTIPISAGKNRIQNIIINKLKKYPHIWEELFYRGGPALLASMTIFALMPLTAISNLFIIPAILFGIFIFSISQRKFIEAHILEDWISKQNLTSKEIRALRIFGKFPTKEKEEEFKIFSEQEYNKVKKESIRKATGKLIAPYIISISLAFIVPAIPVIIATTSAATITAQVYHYEHNEEQKEILDIENEFKEIGDLMSNPDAREVTEISLNSLVNRNKAISVFNSVIDDLMKRINDDQVRSQLEEITVADLEKNIDEINKYGEVVERLATLAKQIDQFKGDKEIKQEMESQFLYFIDGLCEKLVLLYKDETTGYHALRSTRNVVEKAKYLNLSLEEKYKLTIAGLMHDIGKNLSPDGILNKPGSLTSEEELVMHAHVWLGGCILKGSMLHDFSEIAENHHFTNSSLRQYSARSLTGDPFFSQEGDNLSKIFSLMDVFEAVSYKISIDSERPYQLVAYPESFREIILFDAIEDLLQQIENGKTTLDLSVSERNFLIDTIRNKQIEIKRAQEELEKIIDEKFALQRQRNKESDEKKQKELDSKLAAIGNEIAEKQKIVSELKENFENYIFYNETDNVVVQHIRRETSLIEILNKIKELDKEDINAIKELVDDLLYQETNDEMILFVRNKKREIVREKAFSTISTLDIQTVVAKMLFPQEDENIVKEKFRTDPKYWQEQKQKFIEEFKRNPKLWSNRIWDAIDKFRVEFEEENLKTFFEFYFNEEDERISGEMLGIFSRIEQSYKDTTTNIAFISPVVMFFNRAKNFMPQLNIFGSSTDSTKFTTKQRQTLIEKIAKLVKNNDGTINFDIIEKIFSHVPKEGISKNEIIEIYNDVNDGTANLNEYSREKKEIYFLFVLLNKSSSDHNLENFPNYLIYAANSSIFGKRSYHNTNWKMYSYYKNNGRVDEDNADAILKMFSALYAYKTWNDFEEKNPSNMINDHIELKNGHVLSFKNWVHVCDGHSVFTNGIETIVKADGHRINSFDYYGNDDDAINAIVSLDLLLDENIFLPIINTPDIFILELKKPNSEEPYKVYIKKIDNKVHIYVFQPVGDEMELKTFYSKSYIHNIVNMEEVLQQRLEEKEAYNTDINKNIVVAMTSSIDGGVTIRGNNDFDKRSDARYRLITNFDVHGKKIVAESNLESIIAFDNSLYESVASWSKTGVNNPFDGQFAKLSELLKGIVKLSNNLPNSINRDVFIDFICSAFDRRDIIKLVNDEDSLDYTDENHQKAKRAAGRLFRDDNKLINDMIEVNKNGKISNFLGERLYSRLLQDFFEDVDRGSSIDTALSQLRTNIIKNIYEEIYKRKIPYALREFDEQNISASAAAILPENMSTVNTMLQQGRSALRVATWVVLQEADFALSMERDENGEYAFVKAHGDNTSGAIELMKFIENWQNKTKWLNKIAPRLAQKILRQASIVKHIAIDYRFIKASGIQEAIKMFGKNARLNEDGQVEVAIVEDIEQLQNSFTLINTGLKINGASIYRIKDSDLLMFGAKGQQSIKIVQAIDGTEQLKKSVKEMLNAMGEQIDEVETQGIVRKDGEGIEIKEGVIEIGEMSLKGKTSQQIKEFITSSLEINRATGIMYGQKTIIDLGHDESIKIVSNDDNNLEKLKLAIENGRARKVITKEQYDSLKKDKNNEKEDGFKEYLIELRENGIELYIDNSNGLLSEQEIENSKKDGIVGQIITKEGKVLIHDYYSEDKTELLKVDSEILKKKSLEQIILSSDKPIFVGIEILKEQFKQQNINVVQREFGALLGKIKLGLNIGTLNQYDVENMGYNISFEKVPELTQEQISGLFEKDETGKLQIVSKDKITQTIGTENSFAIILNSIKDEKTQIRFKEILVERILAKSSLKQQNKEYGLKDKKMEILLGQMLLKQVDKKDKQTINLDDNFKGTKEDIIRKIMEETQRANEGNETAINTIIEIILVYGEDRKLKQIEGEDQKNISSGYRAMLSAA